jgi:hypothetical protein
MLVYVWGYVAVGAVSIMMGVLGYFAIKDAARRVDKTDPAYEIAVHIGFGALLLWYLLIKFFQ